LDIWQIGILSIDLFSKGTLLEYIKHKYGSVKDGVKVYTDIGHAEDPALKLRDFLDDASKIKELNVSADLMDRITDIKTELRMNIDFKISFNQFVKNCLKKDRYER